MMMLISFIYSFQVSFPRKVKLATGCPELLEAAPSHGSARDHLQCMGRALTGVPTEVIFAKVVGFRFLPLLVKEIPFHSAALTVKQKGPTCSK